MEIKLNDFKTDTQHLGLKINTIKTKEMRNNRNNYNRLPLCDKEVHHAMEFSYLGNILGSDERAALNCKTELTKRNGPSANSALYTAIFFNYEENNFKNHNKFSSMLNPYYCMEWDLESD